MRCLITGVAGFVGSSLADKLLSLGHDVLGIDSFVDYYPREIKERNLHAAREYDKFEFLEGDLCDSAVQARFAGAEWIFHQAAQAGVRASWGKDFSVYTHNNIRATQELLEQARSGPLGESLKKIIYASSSSVYGETETLPTSERIRPAPLSPYGVTKLAAEHLMVLYAKEFGVPSASLRYFTVYGPRQRPDMAFNKFISAGLRGQAIDVYGTGEQTRDFTYIDDIVAANIAAAESETSELVFNIGGGSRVSLNQVIEQIGDILGSPLEINRAERQAGDAPHTGADTSLAERELSYKPEVSLTEGLTKEAEWLRALL